MSKKDKENFTEEYKKENHGLFCRDCCEEKILPSEMEKNKRPWCSICGGNYQDYDFLKKKWVADLY